MASRRQFTAAVLWVLTSTGMYTLIFAAAKFADGAVGAFQITFLRFLGSFGTVIVLAQTRGGWSVLRSPRPGAHFLRALTGCSAAVAVTSASAHMPIADATAIGMLYGALTVLLGLIFLGERISRIHWIAIACSVCGAILVAIAQGAFQSAAPLVPMLLSLLAAVLLAVEGLLIHVLSGAERAITVLAYVSGFGVLLMAAPAYGAWQPIDAGTVLVCLALGPFAVLAQYCTIRGYRLAPLSVVGSVDYAWLVFAMGLGVVAFGEIPPLPVLMGSALILIGGWLLTRMRAPN